jgi:hypothetical protein
LVFSEEGIKTMVATEATEATEVLARSSPANQYGEEYEPRKRRKTRKKVEAGDEEKIFIIRVSDF